MQNYFTNEYILTRINSDHLRTVYKLQLIELFILPFENLFVLTIETTHNLSLAHSRNCLTRTDHVACACEGLKQN